VLPKTDAVITSRPAFSLGWRHSPSDSPRPDSHSLLVERSFNPESKPLTPDAAVRGSAMRLKTGPFRLPEGRSVDPAAGERRGRLGRRVGTVFFLLAIRDLYPPWRSASADDAEWMFGKFRNRLAPVLTEASSWMSDRRAHGSFDRARPGRSAREAANKYQHFPLWSRQREPRSPRPIPKNAQGARTLNTRTER